MSVVKKDSLAKLRIDRSNDMRPPRRKRFVFLAVGCVVLLLTVAGIFFGGGLGFLESWVEVPDAIRTRKEVRVVRAIVQSGRSADATVVATGYLESRRQAKIGARAPGRIQTLDVEEGTRVTNRQVLAVLEHADMDASLAAARAMLTQARAQLAEQEVEIQRTAREHARATELLSKSSISTADFDVAKYQYESAVARRETVQAAIALAEARVEEAEQLRENMFIRASFDGTVISKDAEVGESILPGGMGEASGRGSVVTIADLDHLEVECDVKEDFISRVTSGRAAEVAVDAVQDRRYQGRVRKIIPMGDRARATIKVKVEILDADEQLFPEMSATVYFLPDDNQTEASDEPRIFCASDAIVTDDQGQGQHVFVVGDDNRIRRVEVVTLGADRDGQTELESGLSGRERCVVQPSAELKDGELVKISE